MCAHPCRTQQNLHCRCCDLPKTVKYVYLYDVYVQVEGGTLKVPFFWVRMYSVLTTITCMPLIPTSAFCASHNLFLVLRFSPSSWKTGNQERLSLLFLWITPLVTCHQWGHTCSVFFLIFHINSFSLPRQYLDFINVSLKFTFFSFWTQGKLSCSLNLKVCCD